MPTDKIMVQVSLTLKSDEKLISLAGFNTV